MENIYERAKKILEELNKDVYEKEEVIALTFLSAIAGESIFLLGAPGVAKSLVARRLKYAFENGKSFEYLMNRFSTPDEIFGPVSINKLKEDKYERLTEKYLPTSNVIFLDEIWKAGPSIQNALLTILNEKVYRNGDKEEKVDIRAIISASNELPEQNQGLEALWDRFLIRYLVDSIQNVQNFNDMITKSLESYKDNVDKKIKIKDDEYNQWTEKIDEIKIPSEVLNVIQVIRRYLDEIKNSEERVYISDRRWRKIVRILRTSAFLNNRENVDLMDCFLIAHCIWNEPKQFEKLKELVAKAIKEHGFSLELKSNSIKKEIKDFDFEVKGETKVPKQYYETSIKEYDNQYYHVYGLEIHQIHYILISDFKKLTTNEIAIYGFNEMKQQVRQMYAKQGNEQYTFQVNTNFNIDRYRQNNQWFAYQAQIKNEVLKIETQKILKEQETTKKPNQRLIQEWNKVANIIKSNIETEIKKAENYRNTQLKSLQINLFVDKRLSRFVEGNIVNAISDLKQLDLQVEKIKHYYETIK